MGVIFLGGGTQVLPGCVSSGEGLVVIVWDI